MNLPVQNDPVSRGQLLLAVCFCGLFATCSVAGAESRADWATVDPEESGWDTAKLEALLNYVGEQRSSGVLIVQDGMILAEQYWSSENYAEGDRRFEMTLHGTNDEGRTIEDVASAQKSIAALLVGVAQEKGHLSIEDPVHKHLGWGWSRAERAQEAKITIRHLITMTSGLANDLTYEAEPGTRWRYNTTAYAHCMHVAAAASGMSPQELTRAWLTEPLGLKDSAWTFRPGMRNASIRDTNGFAFVTTNRDLARIGLMVLANGVWKDRTIIADEDYIHDATSPSQDLNPSYGYLWWLNGQSVVRGGNGLEARKGPLIEKAPADLFAAQGARQRKLYIVPSMSLVVTRLGNQPHDQDFNNQFWQRLMAAAPE